MLEKGRNLTYLSVTVTESSFKNNLRFYYILFAISTQKKKMFSVNKISALVISLHKINRRSLASHDSLNFVDFNLRIFIKKDSYNKKKE